MDEVGALAYRLARFVTAQTVARYPRLAPDRDEILSDAMYGAARALARFDPSLGAPLSAYILLRARGEVMDGIRRRSPLSRGDAAKGLNRDDAAPAQQPPVRLDSLDPRGRPLAELIPAQRGPCPLEQVEARVDAQRVVRDLLPLLPPRMQEVVRALYYEGLTGAALARRLQVTESRISQIHTQAIQTLRRLAA